MLQQLKKDKDNISAMLTTFGGIVIERIEEVTDTYISVYSLEITKEKKQIINKSVIRPDIILAYTLRGGLQKA